MEIKMHHSNVYEFENIYVETQGSIQYSCIHMYISLICYVKYVYLHF